MTARITLAVLAEAAVAFRADADNLSTKITFGVFHTSPYILAKVKCGGGVENDRTA